MGGKWMSLEQASRENIEIIMRDLAKRLVVANGSLFNPEHYDEAQYEDLYDIYEMVQRKEKLSISELDAVLLELGRLRKK
jgi:uncharacterized protein YfkK (UPF0435 family)